jgi:hypothetical protein
MGTNSVCDPTRPAALAPLICRPHGVTLFGATSLAMGTLAGLALGANRLNEGAMVASRGLRFLGAAGLVAAGAFVIAASPEVTEKVRAGTYRAREKIADLRESRAARRDAEIIPVAVPVVPTGYPSISESTYAPNSR